MAMRCWLPTSALACGSMDSAVPLDPSRAACVLAAPASRGGHACELRRGIRVSLPLMGQSWDSQGELRAVTAGYRRFGEVLSVGSEVERTEQLVIKRVRELIFRLDTRANDEITSLPFRS